MLCESWREIDCSILSAHILPNGQSFSFCKLLFRVCIYVNYSAIGLILARVSKYCDPLPNADHFLVYGQFTPANLAGAGGELLSPFPKAGLFGGLFSRRQDSRMSGSQHLAPRTAQ